MEDSIVLAVAEKLKLLPELRRRVNALQQVYLTSPELKLETERAILYLAQKYGHHVLLESPTQEQASGDYPLGCVHCGTDRYPFALRKPELLRHMGIYAMTGGGKSIALDAILQNLLKDKVPCLIFDWDGSHRHFLSRPEGQNLLYFTPGSDFSPLPFNPVRVPEDFSYQQHRSYVAALFHSMTQRHLPNETLNREGVRFLLMRAVEHLARQGESGFTFQEMYDAVFNNKIRLSEREHEWRITLLNFLSRLTTGPIGQVFDSEAHIPTSFFLGEQTLIDLGVLIHPVEKADFIESFLFNLYECHLKQSQPIDSPQTLRFVIAIEEIHHIGDSVLKVFFREMRKWGAGLIFTAQHPSLVDIQIRGNCYTSICQNLESPEDLETMGNTMLLSRRDLPYIGNEFSYLSRIPAGSGLYLAKLQGRFTKPFCIRVRPLLQESSQISQEGLKSRLLPIYKKLGIQLSADGKGRKILNLSFQTYRREKILKHLSRTAKDLLVDILKHPVSKLTDRYSRIGGNGHRARKESEKLGLIEPEVVPNGRGGVVRLRLTELGEDTLEALGHHVEPPKPGSPGWEHDYLKSELAWYLETVLGWRPVRKEHVIGSDPTPRKIDYWSPPLPEGERVDIHAEKNGKKVAFEIETGKSYFIKNIFKCLDAGYDVVVSVAINAEVRDKIKASLDRMTSAGLKAEGRVFVVSQGEAKDFVKGYLDVFL